MVSDPKRSEVSMRGLLSVLAAVTAVLSFGVAAAVITETTANSPFTPGSYNQGWWSDTAPNREGTTNDNYFTGQVRSPGGLGETRSFFTFDLSDIPVSDIIVGADL